MLSGALYKASPVHPALKESVGSYRSIITIGTGRSSAARSVNGSSPKH